MTQRIDAIFENGVFRPAGPVDIVDGEHVLLNVEIQGNGMNELNDVNDLLDVEFTEACRQHSTDAPSLEEVRKMLSSFNGSLADRISEERDER